MSQRNGTASEIGTIIATANVDVADRVEREQEAAQGA